MDEPVRVEIPIEGYDAESRAISAAIYLLEEVRFSSVQAGISLSFEQKERVVKYLASRYVSDSE
jgi:hypothetical protein